MRLGEPICTKVNSPLVGGTFFKEGLDAAEAFRDALGVVDAVHADAHEGGLDAQVVEQRGAFQVRQVLGQRFGVRAIDRDADGERLYQRQMPFAQNTEALAVDARLESAIDRIQEIVAMALDVESDQVGAEQSVEQLALPGANAERLGIGPGDVPEDGDAGIRAPLLDHPRQERKVIVLDEHHGRFFLGDFLEHGIGELAVHHPVGFPVVNAKDRPRVRDVTERPQALIGEAEIESLVLFRSEPDAAQGVLRMIRRDAQPAMRHPPSPGRRRP